MTPANLMAAFNKAGDYPLNRHAIPVNNVIEQDPIDGTSASPTNSTKETATIVTKSGPSVPSSTSGDQFTADQMTKFQRPLN